ncbi:MAG: hypothetical protein WCQ50_06680 [Spirochaetota bacterium]
MSARTLPASLYRDRLMQLLDALSEAQLGERGIRSNELQRSALKYETVERLPVIFSWPQTDESRFAPLPNSSIYQDPAAMLYNELVSAWELSIANREGLGDELAPTIRPNWGTVIVASVLEGMAEQREEHTPWIRRSGGQSPSLKSIAEADPDIAKAGWVPRVLETYLAYQELLAPYLEQASALRITLPDLQGPLDTVEQLCGEELFVELLENPQQAARAFMRAAELQVAGARLFAPFTNDGPAGFSHQHGFLVKGGILIRCDSAVMISPELYRDLVAPADEFVLSELGGGGLHSCGRIGHSVPEMLKLPSLCSFDFGQSSMNDVDSLYKLARERRIPFLRVEADKEELTSGAILRRFPTGVSLHCKVVSLEEATSIFDRYLESTARVGTAQ